MFGLQIDYSNIPRKSNKIKFVLNWLFNRLRSWVLFRIKYHNIGYSGFVRVMHGTKFNPVVPVTLGNNVQFGFGCFIDAPITIGNNVLFAGSVHAVGKHDHEFSIPGQTIWQGKRGEEETTIVEDDVWVGHGAILLGGVTIGKGSIVAAGSVVTRNIPPCEIWGGNPAVFIKNRFATEEEKNKHIEYLENEIC